MIVGHADGVGFTYSGGVFTTVPGFTPTGITNDGTLVGIGFDQATGTQYGVISSNGVDTRFEVPGAAHTNIRHVSSDGRYITGDTNEIGGGTPGGYVYDRVTGTLTDLTVAGAFTTIVQGVNTLGQATGSFTRLPELGGSGSFIFDTNTGVRTDYLEAADPQRPRFRDINDFGLLAGFRSNASRALVGAPGDWTEFTLPAGAASIFGYGLNNRGDLVGFYIDTAGQIHGFLATPLAQSQVVFDFLGQCSDCQGTVSAQLTLRGSYVPGTPIAAADFISFVYGGSDLLHAYSVTLAGDDGDPATTDFLFTPGLGIAGTMPAGQPAASDFSLVFGSNFFFIAESNGSWRTCAYQLCDPGADIHDDFGRTSSFARAADVPEPGSLPLWACASLAAALAVRTRRRAA